MTTFLKGDSSAEITLVLAEGCDYSGKTLYLSYQGALRVFPVIEAGGTVAFSFTAKETASMSLGAYPVRVWLKGEDGGTVTIHNGAVKLRVTDCVADVRSDKAMYLDVRGGLYGLDGLPDRWNENDLKAKIDEIIRRLGGTVALLLFCVLPAFCAGPLTVQTAPKGEVYNDAHIVTNVDFDVSALEAKADATNTYTKAETDAAIVRLAPTPDFTTGNTQLVATIEATAPAPGNYLAVSNAAMNALSRADAEAGFTEWRVYDPAGEPAEQFLISYADGMWTLRISDRFTAEVAGPPDAERLNFSDDGIERAATRTRLPTMADLPTDNAQLANGAGYVTASITNGLVTASVTNGLSSAASLAAFADERNQRHHQHGTPLRRHAPCLHEHDGGGQLHAPAACFHASPCCRRRRRRRRRVPDCICKPAERRWRRRRRRRNGRCSLPF